MRYNFFRFKRLDNRYLLTNDLGNYLLVSPEEFHLILRKQVDEESVLGRRLVEGNIAYTDTDLEFSSSKRFELRQSKGFENIATSLHIFVVTTACNAGCVYCQARDPLHSEALFMSEETAEKAVDVALQSPARCLSFEFQGGEPLLNFPVIKHIVLYSEAHKGNHEIAYNIVTNLTLLTDEILDFLAEHDVGISTSIDGPESLHNANRPFRKGGGTFAAAIASIEKIRGRGLHVGAIQTTTRASLLQPDEIVQVYVNLGFESVFVRPLTPLGKAQGNWGQIGYTTEEFLEFYRRVVDKVISINRAGNFFKEEHASILMGRIEGRLVNYMELRSPCGAGVGQLAYYPNGKVFTCDEGRMVYEMGEDTFCLGDAREDSYSKMVGGSVCRAVCASSILETIPSCCDCVYQPYCGTCPVVNYASNQDVIEKEPRGYRCRLYSGMLDYLFGLLSSDNERDIAILRSWGN